MLGQNVLALRALSRRRGPFAPIQMTVLEVNLMDALDQFRVCAIESLSDDSPKRFIDQE